MCLHGLRLYPRRGIDFIVIQEAAGLFLRLFHNASRLRGRLGEYRLLLLQEFLCLLDLLWNGYPNLVQDVKEGVLVDGCPYRKRNVPPSAGKSLKTIREFEDVDGDHRLSHNH